MHDRNYAAHTSVVRLFLAALSIVFAAGHCTAPLLAQQAKSRAALLPMDVVESISPQGRWLEFKQGQKRRVHLWYDKGVWHFRCTCGVNPTAFDGAVTVDKGAVRVVGGQGDYEKRGAAGKVLNPQNADYVQVVTGGLKFRFQCVGSLNGLDFLAPKDAKTIRFEFLVNGVADAESIFIGAAGEHPSQATFSLPAHPQSRAP